MNWKMTVWIGIVVGLTIPFYGCSRESVYPEEYVKGNIKYITDKDNCASYIRLLEFEGRRYLYNIEGGIIEIKGEYK